MASQGESTLPLRPKEEQSSSAAPSAAPSTTEAPSKSAAKKAAQKKEKAEKAAKRQEQERIEREKADANDTSKHLYGALTLPDTPPTEPQMFHELVDLYEAKEDQDITVDAWVHNARVQSAKLAFLVLRDECHTIQAVIAEGGAHGISRQMVKWCGGINSESYVRVTGLVKKPVEPVKSTTISNFELHIEKIYIVSEAAEMLPIQVKDCERPPPLGEEAANEDANDEQGRPIVSLNSRLNSRVLAVRAAADQAIFQIQGAICDLFFEYMNKNDFHWIQSSKIAGAATEGGSGVFQIKYFDREAYLTQSPQFFKQMAIAMGMKRVCEIGPVFRAENSNTHRHLTEVYSLTFHTAFSFQNKC